jgi:heme A synthase
VTVRLGWRLLVQILVVVAGLVALGWAVLAPIGPIRCHEQVMGPGDVCAYSSLDGQDKGRSQTYEQRLGTERSARPVVGVVGAGVAGFGLVLLASSRRRDRLTRSAT